MTAIAVISTAAAIAIAATGAAATTIAAIAHSILFYFHHDKKSANEACLGRMYRYLFRDMSHTYEWTRPICALFAATQLAGRCVVCELSLWRLNGPSTA